MLPLQRTVDELCLKPWPSHPFRKNIMSAGDSVTLRYYAVPEYQQTKKTKTNYHIWTYHQFCKDVDWSYFYQVSGSSFFGTDRKAGWDGLRPFQRDVIAAWGDGRDVLVTLATGAGKSERGDPAQYTGQQGSQQRVRYFVILKISHN